MIVCFNKVFMSQLTHFESCLDVYLVQPALSRGHKAAPPVSLNQ